MQGPLHEPFLRLIIHVLDSAAHIAGHVVGVADEVQARSHPNNISFQALSVVSSQLIDQVALVAIHIVDFEGKQSDGRSINLRQLDSKVAKTLSYVVTTLHLGVLLFLFLSYSLFEKSEFDQHWRASILLDVEDALRFATHILSAPSRY